MSSSTSTWNFREGHPMRYTSSLGPPSAEPHQPGTRFKLFPSNDGGDTTLSAISPLEPETPSHGLPSRRSTLLHGSPHMIGALTQSCCPNLSAVDVQITDFEPAQSFQSISHQNEGIEIKDLFHVSDHFSNYQGTRVRGMATVRAIQGHCSCKHHRPQDLSHDWRVGQIRVAERTVVSDGDLITYLREQGYTGVPKEPITIASNVSVMGDSPGRPVTETGRSRGRRGRRQRRGRSRGSASTPPEGSEGGTFEPEPDGFEHLNSRRMVQDLEHSLEKRW